MFVDRSSATYGNTTRSFPLPMSMTPPTDVHLIGDDQFDQNVAWLLPKHDLSRVSQQLQVISGGLETTGRAGDFVNKVEEQDLIPGVDPLA